jgi:wobble nucleotide-excising tRNase
MAAYATSNNKERHVDKAVCQPGAAPWREEVPQRQRQASELQQWEMQAEDLEQRRKEMERRLQAMEEPLQRIEQRLNPPQPGEQQILQSCRFRDNDCFVEGAMIAPSINDEMLLKEERP